MEQAFACIDRALELRPNFSAALNEKARALWSLQLLDEAFATFHKSLAVDPGNAGTIWNLALLQMLTGDFERGWAGREARWKASLGLVERGFSQPLWLGDQPIERKTILLHADKAWATRFSLRATCPSWPRSGLVSSWRSSRRSSSFWVGLPGVADCLDRVFDDAGVRPALSASEACRWRSGRGSIRSRSRKATFLRRQWRAMQAGKTAPPPRRFRVGLVWSGTRAQQRSRSFDRAAHACAAARLRRPVRLLAKVAPGPGRPFSAHP